MKKILLQLLAILFAIASMTDASGQAITTIAGGATGHGGYWGDGGPATAAEIGVVGSIAVDAYGNIYIPDAPNERIRKVDAITGIITTIAGTGVAGYNGDGILATTAQINFPAGVGIDNNGDLFIYDASNNRIRKVDPITGIISTFAGNGTYGSTGDGSPATAAEISGGAMVWDALGNMYFSDNHKIRKVDTLGTISTFAGSGLGGITGEGVPATATNMYPGTLGIDASGNIYFNDTTYSIRKITISTGLITRVGGTGDNLYFPYSGDGLAATSCHIGPEGIFVDNVGNIYVADQANSRIEKIDASSGIINSIAGTGTIGYMGDGGPATACELNESEGVALDACGNVYIADFGNNVVRKITYPSTPISVSVSGPSSEPIGTTVTINATVTAPGSGYTIKWMNHGIVFATTNVPTVTYTKGIGIDTITAGIVRTSADCNDTTTSVGHVVGDGVEGLTPALSTGGAGGVRVYPNPVNDIIYVAGSLTEIRHVSVCDLLGQVMISSDFNAAQVQVNVRSLAAGMYLIKATDGEGVMLVGKFLKQ